MLEKIKLLQLNKLPLRLQNSKHIYRTLLFEAILDLADDAVLRTRKMHNIIIGLYINSVTETLSVYRTAGRREL